MLLRPNNADTATTREACITNYMFILHFIAFVDIEF